MKTIHMVVHIFNGIEVPLLPFNSKEEAEAYLLGKDANLFKYVKKDINN